MVCDRSGVTHATVAGWRKQPHRKDNAPTDKITTEDIAIFLGGEKDGVKDGRAKNTPDGAGVDSNRAHSILHPRAMRQIQRTTDDAQQTSNFARRVRCRTHLSAHAELVQRRASRGMHENAPKPFTAAVRT
jgi:hypothetical protein